jgi:hypothetical protein
MTGPSLLDALKVAAENADAAETNVRKPSSH